MTLLKITKILAGIFFITNISHAQVVESEWITIQINNEDDDADNIDTIPPTISIISPWVAEGNVVDSDYDRIMIVGKVADDNGFVTLLVDSLEVNPDSIGIFNIEITLHEGVNKLIFFALDQSRNIAKKILLVSYYPRNGMVFSIKDQYYAILCNMTRYIYIQMNYWNKKNEHLFKHRKFI